MDVVDRIKKALVYKPKQKKREYIGASIIGHPCLRHIWYALKGKKSEFSSSAYLIFEFGNLIERLVMHLLKMSELEIIAPAPINQMLELKSSNLSFFKGHADGLLIADSKKYILEIKSANNSQFNQCVKKGIKLWKELYYAQAQAYAHFAVSDGIIFIVVNKDNSKFHVEFIEKDDDYCNELEDKATQIFYSKDAPPKISGTPSYFTCKLCSYKNICHGGDNEDLDES